MLLLWRLLQFLFCIFILFMLERSWKLSEKNDLGNYLKIMLIIIFLFLQHIWCLKLSICCPNFGTCWLIISWYICSHQKHSNFRITLDWIYHYSIEISIGSCWHVWLAQFKSYCHINSSDAGDGIFRFWGVSTMPADALAPKVASASAGMLLAVYDRQHVCLFQS